MRPVLPLNGSYHKVNTVAPLLLDFSHLLPIPGHVIGVSRRHRRGSGECCLVPKKHTVPTVLTINKYTFLSQMVTEPTRQTDTSASIIELFFTSNDTLMNQTRVLPGVLDHEAVFVESSLRPTKKQVCPRCIFKYQKADYDGFRQKLKKLIPSLLEKANTLDLNTL